MKDAFRATKAACKVWLQNKSSILFAFVVCWHSKVHSPCSEKVQNEILREFQAWIPIAGKPTKWSGKQCSLHSKGSHTRSSNTITVSYWALRRTSLEDGESISKSFQTRGGQTF